MHTNNSTMSNQLNLNTSWEEVKEKLKENDAWLTDEDLEYEPGKEQELYERLAKKLDKNPEQIRHYVESIATNIDKAG